MAGNGECEWSTVGKNRLVNACREFAYRKCWDEKQARGRWSFIFELVNFLSLELM